jgi:hypothetical protein
MMFEFHWATLILMGIVMFVIGAIAATEIRGQHYG